MKGRELLITVATTAIALSALAIASVVVHREFAGPRLAANVQTNPSGRVDRLIPEWRTFEKDGHRMGPASAALTIIEFGDFECPACAQFSEIARPVLRRHQQDVALVFIHWPLPYHRLAYPSARAAECAGEQGRFSEYHDVLYASHDSLGLVPFAELARRAGVRDTSGFSACYRSSAPVAAIDRGAEIARRMQFLGTPTLIVNGKLLAIAPDSAGLEQMILDAKQKLDR